MRPDYFYYGTAKNIIAAFGILFRDVEYVNDWGQTIKVPIHYLPREKFLEITEVSADHDDGYETMTTLPRFGFELISVDYDSTRMLNPMGKMRDIQEKQHRYMFSRVPYNFSFNLYLAAIKFEDSLKIIEQIIPFFTPELNITIKDKEDFEIYTDIPIVLNNSSFQIDYLGNFDNRRTIQWILSFTAKAYLYSNTREQIRIKETIVKMSNKDLSMVYETLISEVDPRQAEKNDAHQIIDTVIEGPPESIPALFTMDVSTGTSAIIDSEGDLPNIILTLHPISYGASMRIVPMPGSL